MMKDANDINRIFEGIKKLDINKMSWVDQMRYVLYVSKFAEDMEPLVKKYAKAGETKGELFDELLQYFKDADKEPHDTEIKPEDDEVDDAED